MRLIIAIQALWRGYSARKLVNFIKQTKRVSMNENSNEVYLQADSKYFTMDESRETVTNQRYNPKAKREERPMYTFKTGATYQGQWVGGFRDGFGVQVWPDGARYEG